jgi:hypothetical protein
MLFLLLQKNITEMNPEERINNPKYLNWIKGTLALMHLCDVVRNYAYHIFDKFLDTISDRPHYDNGSNYKYLASHTEWDSGQWKYTSSYQCVCQSLFKEILRLHFFGDKRLGFTNCKDKYVGGPWGLAKFFMPVDKYCADIERPEETEPTIVLKMIQNCRLFDHIAHANIEIVSILATFKTSSGIKIYLRHFLLFNTQIKGYVTPLEGSATI